jgi:GNAT superfamily N-acetyltransferase
MIPPDVPAGVRLSEQAGWNQTPDDWLRLLAWQPGGCFVAEHAGRVVGTVTTTVYGPRLAWIGMMLVDAALRRQGLGRALLSHAVDWIERTHGAQTIALDATALGKMLYDGMGFVDGFTLQRYEGVAPRLSAPPEARPLRIDHLPRLAPLDRSAFGVDRLRVLQALARAHPTGCFLLEGDDGEVLGYVCSRPGAHRWYIGPLVAHDRSAAEAVLRAALAPRAGQPITLDLPDPNAGAVHLAAQYGLRPRRAFVRMARGAPLPRTEVQRYFAIGGPETG